MNRCYRLVWNRARRCLVVAAEIARGHRKPGRTLPRMRAVNAGSALAALLAFAPLLAASAPATPAIAPNAAPRGGTITAGTGAIHQDGAGTRIEQQSQNLALDWQSFNVGVGQRVDFVQPGAGSLAVNRIADPRGSVILGQLHANGQVFLLNPNGVLFGPSAQVSAGGLVASTLDLGEASSDAGRRQFSGSGRGRVVNQGTLRAAPGGYVALIGPEVTNRGTLSAPGGTVALGAGDAVSLSFDADRLLSLRVDRSSLDALADNGGLVQASGGQVLMSAGARNAVLASVVNNSGQIEAQTVGHRNGRIVLLGGMEAGTATVAGTLDASAPKGGDGGFIETSAAKVRVADGASVTTLAAAGKAGTWLIDPQDYTIAAAGGDISGATLSANLGSGNVEIQSSGGATAGSGNIDVNDAVAWGANTTLTLTASHDVNVNANLTATGAGAGLVLTPDTANGTDAASGTGQYRLNDGAVITLSGANPALSIAGQPYTVITALGAGNSSTGKDLQGMRGNLAGHYALGSDIDASPTVGWNGGSGFGWIGAGTAFTGTFDGLGHSIRALTTVNSGFFGTLAAGSAIRNLALYGRSAVGSNYVAGLLGNNYGVIDQVTLSGTVTGSGSQVGGLVARNYGAISRSSVAGAVSGFSSVGGLVATSSAGTISQSHADAAVTGAYQVVGGLVGMNVGTAITESYATGAVGGSAYVGGLVGVTQMGSSIIHSWSSGQVTGGASTGGFFGNNWSALADNYWDSWSSGRASAGGGGNAAGVTAVTSNPAQAAAANYAFKPGAYAALDFTPGTGAWFAIDGETRPFLQSEYGTNIHDAHQLQLVAMNLAAAYTLANDIDARGTGRAAGSAAPADASDMWSAAGFHPLGDTTTPFAGTLDGQGHAILGLTIDRPSTSGVGLIGEGGSYGYSGAHFAVRNLGLEGGSVTGFQSVGALAGMAYNPDIQGSYAAVTVSADGYAGGLVGDQRGGSIDQSYATGNVTAGAGGVAAGLVGFRLGGTIDRSYATGNVTSASGYAGGLVAYNDSADVSRSYATGSVTGTDSVGGLVGANFDGVISRTYATGQAAGSTTVGGLAGYNGGSFGGSIDQSWASGAVSGGSGTGGLVGVLQTGSPFPWGNGKVTASYWDSWSTGRATAIGDGTNVGSSAVTSDPAKSSTGTYAFRAAAYPGLDFSADWFNIKNGTRPFLRSEYATSIGNAHQLQLMAMDLSASYVLARSIDAGETGRAVGSAAPADAAGMWNTPGFQSVGNATTPFTGTFDGDGQTVAGLTGPSFFGTTAAGSTVRDIGLTARKAAGGNGLGGLAGSNYGSIDRAFVVGVVDGAGGMVGGLVAYNYGSISRSWTAGSVDGTANVGGLVGSNPAGGKISQSYSSATITGSTSIGGLVGINAGATITQSYATGAVSGDSQVGGLAGVVQGASSVTESFASGKVTGNTRTGGFAGYGNSSITGSYWDSYGSSQAAGVGAGSAPGLSAVTSDPGARGTANDAFQQATYAGWNVAVTGGSASPWRIYPGQTMPLLRTFMTLLPVATDNAATTYNGTAFAGSSAYRLGLPVPGYWLPADTVNPALVMGTANTAAPAVNAGSYALNAGLYSTQMGYDLKFTAGTLTIARAPLGVTGAVAADKVYDGTAQAAVSGATLSGTVYGSDDVTLANATSGTFADKNAGTGKAVATAATLAGTRAGNYVLSQEAGLTADITPAPLTVTGIAAVDKVYDGGTGATLDYGGATFAGKISGDTLTIGAATGTFDGKDAGSGKTVTITGITLGGADAGNYALAATTASATARIDQALLNVEAGNVTRTYDGTAYAGGAGVSYSGFVAGETTAVLGGTLAWGGTAQGARNAGHYTLVPTGLSAVNYSIGYVSGTLTIDPAPLGIGTVAVTKAYDGTTAAAGSPVAVTGTLFGSDSFSGGSYAFDTKDVGTGKTVTVSGVTVNDGNGGANYAVGYVPNTASSITPAQVTVTLSPIAAVTGIAAEDKVYDGTTRATLDFRDAVFHGMASGDSLDVASASGAFADRNAGIGKSVFISGITLGGADAGNYELMDRTATATADILPLGITVQASGHDKVYDGSTAASVDLAGIGVLAGDQVDFRAAARFEDRNVGAAKPIAIDAVTQGGADAGNYRVLGTPTAHADVTPATLIYAAAPRAVRAGAVPGPLTGSITGWAPGDTAANAAHGTPAWTTDATAASPPGRYAISGSGLAAPNYVFAQAPGNATALEVTALAAPGAPTLQGTSLFVAPLQQVGTSMSARPPGDRDDPWALSMAAAPGGSAGFPVPPVRIIGGGVRMPGSIP